MGLGEPQTRSEHWRKVFSSPEINPPFPFVILTARYCEKTRGKPAASHRSLAVLGGVRKA